MNCPVCGGDTRVGANFCQHCGTHLAASTVSAETPELEALGTPLDGQVQAEAVHMEEEIGATEEGQDTSSEMAASAADTPAPDPGATPDPQSTPDAEAGWAEEPTGDWAGLDDLRQPLRLEADQVEHPAPPGPDGELVAEAEVEPAPAAPDPAEPPELLIGGKAEVFPGEEGAAVGHQGEEVASGVGAVDNGSTLEPGLAPEEVRSFFPVASGSLLAERYMVLGAEDAGDHEILYQVRDLKTCWNCGFEENVPGDGFCGQCGASLDRWPHRTLLEVRDPDSAPASDGTVNAQFEHDGRTFLVLERPAVELGPGAQALPQGLRLVVGHRSDAGLVRKLDEDSLLALSLSATFESQVTPVLGLFAVADGMGGHEGGEIASMLALRVMAREVLQTIIVPELAGESAPDDSVAERLRLATVAANDVVYLARQKRANDMGTTLTTALIRDGKLFIAHVGDSRAYRWDEGGLQQLTTDHSLVASMVSTGRAEPEEVYTHPQRSVIYRCVGDQAVVEVDTTVQPLSPGDRLVVCCDGLWEMIRDEGIADVLMEESDPQVASDLLVDRANAAGGEDNISVIVVQVEAL